MGKRCRVLGGREGEMEREEGGRTGIGMLKKKRLSDPKSLSARCPIVDSFVNYHLLQEVASLMMVE